MLKSLPVPKELTVLMTQLKENSIPYELYDVCLDKGVFYVDIHRAFASRLSIDLLPDHWSLIAPHFLSLRALVNGHGDPVSNDALSIEEIVRQFGGKEAEADEDFRSLCKQIDYLRQWSPSRLVCLDTLKVTEAEVHDVIKLFL